MHPRMGSELSLIGISMTQITCGCGTRGSLEDILKKHLEPGTEKNACTIDQSKPQG